MSYVTSPPPITTGCRLGITSNQNIAGAGSTVPFGAEEYDDNNWHDNTVNNERITVDFTGRINVSANLVISNGTAGNNIVFIRKNGTNQIAQLIYNAAAGLSYVSVDGDFSCSVGDYFDIFATGPAGGSSTQSGTVFSAKRIK